jgi:hypothetical protein
MGATSLVVFLATRWLVEPAASHTGGPLPVVRPDAVPTADVELALAGRA